MVPVRTLLIACLPVTLSAQTAPRLPLPVGDQEAVREAQEGPLGRYRANPMRRTISGDSARLDALTRAGNLYLSLKDAIALAIENNLDVEYQRITPLLAEADLLRARAGGVARGVPSNVREGPTGLGSSGTSISGTTGLQGQPDTGGSSTTGTTVPAAVTASGPGVPNLDPTLIGSIGYIRANRPQTNTFITGTNANISSSSLGDLRLQKGFLLGGVASVGMDATRLNTNNLRADVNPATNAGLAADFVQPLLRGFGLAVNNRYIRIAKNNRSVSDLVFEQQVVSTAYTVARLYWDLVALRSDANVQQESLDLAQRLLAENLQQEQAGTLAPIEVTSTRAAVASVRRNLTVAQTRLRQQETVLKDYLTRGSVDSPALSALRLIPKDTMTLPAQEPIEPLQDLVAEARKKRPEIAQADIQVDNSRITATGSRSALLPALDLVASARSNALFGAINPVPPPGSSSGATVVRQPDPAFVGGVGTGLSQIFAARFPDYSVELQLSIPILNRAARSDYTRDQLAIRQQELRVRQLEKQVSVEVVNALIAVEQSRAAFEAAREAREFQSQSLEAEREKFRVGVSTNFLVIQYQRDLVQAQSAEIAALADYAKARAALDRAVGRLLDRNDISIVEAFTGRMGKPPSKLPVP
jgi:outer membrane protein